MDDTEWALNGYRKICSHEINTGARNERKRAKENEYSWNTPFECYSTSTDLTDSVNFMHILCIRNFHTFIFHFSCFLNRGTCSLSQFLFNLVLYGVFVCCWFDLRAIFRIVFVCLFFFFISSLSFFYFVFTHFVGLWFWTRCQTIHKQYFVICSAGMQECVSQGIRI